MSQIIQPSNNALIVNGEVLYDPHPKQVEYHHSTAPNVLLYGGRGSGKSFCGRFDAHMRALSTPNYKYCILRRNFPELEKTHLMDVPDEMTKFGGYFHKTQHIAYYPNGSTGVFSHCATDVHVLNLLSAQFYLMFFDEVSTFEWEMFTKLAASVRVPRGSGLIAMVRAATNPLGVSADMINRYWVEKDITPEEDPDYSPSDWVSIKANLSDNPSLDSDQYKKRFAGLSSHVKSAWVDGDFALENALFEVLPFKEGKPYHIIKSIELDKLVKGAQIYRVYDAGYFPDPSYCAWIAHLGNRYIVFHEKLWFKTIASDIAREIKEIDEMLGIKKVVITYCDPTIDIKTIADVRTIKDTFEIGGIPMECSVNNREHYASHIHTALGEEAEPGVPRLQIYVHPTSKNLGAPYLAKTLPQQRFDPKHPLRLADHPHDHATVALAYFLISSGAMERRGLLNSPTSRPWMKLKQMKEFVLGHENVKDKV